MNGVGQRDPAMLSLVFYGDPQIKKLPCFNNFTYTHTSAYFANVDYYIILKTNISIIVLSFKIKVGHKIARKK